MDHMLIPPAIRMPLALWLQAHTLLIIAIFAAFVFAALAVSERQPGWRKLYVAFSAGTVASFVGYELLVAI